MSESSLNELESSICGKIAVVLITKFEESKFQMVVEEEEEEEAVPESDMDLNEYDDKCPSWLNGQTPPVQLWVEHFLRPLKNRNVLYTSYFEERVKVCKVKYGFLQPDQVIGIALGELGIPSCGIKISQHFLNRHRKRQSKSVSKLGNVNCRSFRLFEDADVPPSIDDDDDDDSHLQIRAPSPLRAKQLPPPPRECSQVGSIYDDFSEMYEDVVILPFKSLNRRTRPSDICSNDNRKNIKSTKDKRLKLKEKLDCGNLNTIQEDDININSLQSDVASSKQDLDEFEENSSIQDLYEETGSEQSDIDTENDYLSNSIIESDVDGEIEQLNVTLNNFGINEQDWSNIEVEQSEHRYSQNSDVNVTDCNELEILFQNVESQKIERKNLLCLESTKIPIRPENRMIFNEDLDVELFQKPRKREQSFFESQRISVCPANKIKNESRDVGSPENLLKGEQRHHYESARIPICPGNKTIENISSYEETFGENNFSYFQTNNVKKQDQNLLDVTSTMNEKKPSYFQSTSIPIRPENRKHLDRKMEGVILPESCHNKDQLSHFQSELIPIHFINNDEHVNLPEGCHNKDRLSHFQSELIPIHPINNDEHVNLPEGCHNKDQLSSFQSELIPIRPINNDEHMNLSEEHIASQLFVMNFQSPNEHFELNSSSSKSSSFDETVEKITRKRNFTSTFGTSFGNMNDYTTGSEKNTPNYGIASPCSNDEGTSHTQYDMSLEEMMNCDNEEPCEIYTTLETIDRRSSFNTSSLDDDYQMIKSDDSLAVLCKVSKKDEQNLESDVGTEKQSQIKSDGESSTSSMELTPPKRRKRNINTGSTTNILQSSTKGTDLTSQTTNSTECSSQLTVEIRQKNFTDWLAQNEFFNPTSNIRVSDPVLPEDNDGEEESNKLQDIEFSSIEY